MCPKRSPRTSSKFPNLTESRLRSSDALKMETARNKSRSSQPMERSTTTKIQKSNLVKKASRVKEPSQVKATIGWKEQIDLPEFGLTGIPAKIDTGARTSVLHCSHIRLIQRDN